MEDISNSIVGDDIKLYKTINAFLDIELPSSGRPLIICDIDYTLIRPINNFEYFYHRLKKKPITETRARMLAHEFLDSSINLGHVKQSDPDGFKKMTEQINKMDGDLIFLTARHIMSRQKTMDDLNKAGIDGQKYNIHYTGNIITKGEHIKLSNMNNGYDHVYFIDDQPANIQSVIDHVPNAKCYLFKCM